MVVGSVLIGNNLAHGLSVGCNGSSRFPVNEFGNVVFPVEFNIEERCSYPAHFRFDGFKFCGRSFLYGVGCVSL